MKDNMDESFKKQMEFQTSAQKMQVNTFGQVRSSSYFRKSFDHTDVRFSILKI